MSREYNIFISHSWSYSDQYEKLIGLLNNDLSFHYKNYSVPKDDPIHTNGSYSALRESIRRQIQPTSCIIVLAGVYSTYSKWINIEMDLAKSMNKPIIAVEYWGAQRTSIPVKDKADIIVGWNSKSIIGAIRNLC